MIILTVKTVEEYEVDGQVVETNTCIPLKWAVRENWQGEDLELFDTRAEAEQFAKEYEKSQRYNGKGYLVMGGREPISPVFGNEISAKRWLGKHTGIGGLVDGCHIDGVAYEILPVDITLGLLELLNLDNALRK